MHPIPVTGDTGFIGGNSEKKNFHVLHTICAALDESRPGLPHAPCTFLITFVKHRPGLDRRHAVKLSKIPGELDTKRRSAESPGGKTGRASSRALLSSGGYRRERIGPSNHTA